MRVRRACSVCCGIGGGFRGPPFILSGTFFSLSSGEWTPRNVCKVVPEEAGCGAYLDCAVVSKTSLLDRSTSSYLRPIGFG